MTVRLLISGLLLILRSCNASLKSAATSADGRAEVMLGKDDGQYERYQAIRAKHSIYVGAKSQNLQHSSSDVGERKGRSG